VQNIAQFPT